MRAVDDGRPDAGRPGRAVAARVERQRTATTVTIRDLLAHSSGLTAYLPFFRDYTGRFEFEHAICSLPLEYAPRSQSIYSDLGFMLLGFILEDAQPHGPAFSGAPGTLDPSRSLATQFHRLASFFTAEPLRFTSAAGVASPHRADRGRRMARPAARRRSPRREHVGARRRRGPRRAVRHGRRRSAPSRARCCAPSPASPSSPAPTRCGRSCSKTDVPGSSRALGWDTMLPTSSCGTQALAVLDRPHRLHGHVALD